MKNTMLAAILTATAALTAPMATAADYPSKPVDLVIGFPPGGPTDILGRVIAENLSKELGQSVVVVNQGGAGGVVGSNAVAKAKPDGYTLLVAVQSALTRAKALGIDVPYEPVTDFEYIRKVAEQRNLLVVNPETPAKTVEELIAYAKEHPGELNTGGTFGASSHIASSLFDMSNGTEMTFINYSGGGPALIDLLSGVIQVAFFTESQVAEHVRSGSLRALAVASEKHSATFPDLPTVSEAGGAELEISPWFGIAAPAGTPEDTLEVIGDALDRMNSNEGYLDQLVTIGAVPVEGSTPETLSAEVAEEIPFWADWAAKVDFKKQ
ncbi:Bug family tripartite tricarboxylate transporter substrate binding protein [Paracoccus saliphilus]|uniref:Tripartite tricarboxylate transporter substrate binding protein n=1 Tax=Paracoccus saliphilus TaxID=405559 RepID=A0AA45W2L8_9RHOB|nr:tripartite tricarboxylate transporter substrate binding protein [Paracoccus saliphilus]WCR01464.1 tripartite tricarboxylate transporter substrate binding protein [Paracoccus saliphilus]SIS69139.1 Tripartite-type tricarboxylate transporter, receptor component TctC [Paracoccus saliphilus]